MGTLRPFRFLLFPVCLAACTVPSSPPAPPPASVPVEETPVADAAPVADWVTDFERQRIIGDLLYDALRALEDDRLLTPVDDNAHQRYRRVLAYDPNNALALEGLRNIVARYLALSAEASRQGRFETAMTYIERARWVDPQDPAIQIAHDALQAEINSGDLVFTLDPAQVARQTEPARARLVEIAQQARTHDAMFLITAPSDEQARWMFAVMRDAVEGYRLRGNIEIGGHVIVRLRMNSNANTRS